MQKLLVMIPKLISPDSWDETKQTSMEALGTKLIVRQKEEVHRQIGLFINAINSGSGFGMYGGGIF